jgi:hypothetical protein
LGYLLRNSSIEADNRCKMSQFHDRLSVIVTEAESVARTRKTSQRNIRSATGNVAKINGMRLVSSVGSGAWTPNRFPISSRTRSPANRSSNVAQERGNAHKQSNRGVADDDDQRSETHRRRESRETQRSGKAFTQLADVVGKSRGLRVVCDVGAQFV